MEVVKNFGLNSSELSENEKSTFTLAFDNIQRNIELELLIEKLIEEIIDSYINIRLNFHSLPVAQTRQTRERNNLIELTHQIVEKNKYTFSQALQIESVSILFQQTENMGRGHPLSNHPELNNYISFLQDMIKIFSSSSKKDKNKIIIGAFNKLHFKLMPHNRRAQFNEFFLNKVKEPEFISNFELTEKQIKEIVRQIKSVPSSENKDLDILMNQLLLESKTKRISKKNKVSTPYKI